MSDLTIDNDMYGTNQPRDWLPCTNCDNTLSLNLWNESPINLETDEVDTIVPADLPHRPMEQMMVGEGSNRGYGSSEYRKLWARHNDGIIYKRRLGRGARNMYAGVLAGLLMTGCAVALMAISFI